MQLIKSDSIEIEIRKKTTTFYSSKHSKEKKLSRRIDFFSTLSAY